MLNPPDAAATTASAEADFLRRAREGDLDAFNALVEAYQRAAYNLCLRMLGDRMSAEDATQDAFLAAYRSLSSFRGDNFRPWLLRIAANACTDELRRRGRRPARSLDQPLPGTDAPPDPPAPAPGPEALALRKDEQARVQQALLALPEDQRLAVILCDLQGFAYDEIAETMRTSIGTVKSRIARGRDKLRQELLRMREQFGT